MSVFLLPSQPSDREGAAHCHSQAAKRTLRQSSAALAERPLSRAARGHQQAHRHLCPISS
eukprot:5160391-Pyramimonas_sp.AAC.1